MRRRHHEMALTLIEQARERDEFYAKLRALDTLADEFIATCVTLHERGEQGPAAYSLAVRMKQIIGTYKYGPSPFKEREEAQ